jgi:hypothetical protein
MDQHRIGEGKRTSQRRYVIFIDDDAHTFTVK